MDFRERHAENAFLRRLHELMHSKEGPARNFSPETMAALNERYPHGALFEIPQGATLQTIFNKNNGRKNVWFVTDGDIEHVPTVRSEVFVPNPNDWLLPTGTNKPFQEQVLLLEQYSKTLPSGSVAEIPTAGGLTIAMGTFWRYTEKQPLVSDATSTFYSRTRDTLGKDSPLCIGFSRGSVAVVAYQGRFAYPNVGIAMWIVPAKPLTVAKAA